MTLYWIYDLPNWLLGVFIVGFFLGFSLLGLFLTRPLVRRFLGSSPQFNDPVSYIFAGVGVFYGLAMGLIAVATWEDYTGVDGQVSKEAAALASLYRDLDGYPQPLRDRLEGELRDYTRFIIEKDWPAHRRGETVDEGELILDRFENHAMAFEPTAEREKITHTEVVHSLNTLVELRNLRLQSVTTGLPALIWYVVLIGALLNIGLTYLFWVDNRGLHAILVGTLAIFIALLIYLTAAMDNPFRGEFSVSPDAYRMVLDKVMTQSGPVGHSRGGQ